MFCHLELLVHCTDFDIGIVGALDALMEGKEEKSCLVRMERYMLRKIMKAHKKFRQQDVKALN